MDDRLPAEALESVAECVRSVVARQRTDPKDAFYTWAHDYGDFGDVDLVVPHGSPSDWDVDAVRVRAQDRPTYDVVVGMWTKQEGRSDLSLVVDVEHDGSRWVAAARDLHVL
jgi:hypothetical protein